MLDSLADIMADSHGFGWQSAKGAHTVLLFQMEQKKINWDETNKTDHIRRATCPKVTGK